MSTFVELRRKELADYSSRAARITTFGLHYKTDWYELFNMKMMLDALEINDTFDIFTDDEIDCLKSKLLTPIFCTTC